MKEIQKSLRILHLGPEDMATSWARIQALRDLGHEVCQIYYSRLDEKSSFYSKVYHSLRWRIGWPAERCDENATLLEIAERFSPEVIFIEKGLTIWPETLRKLRQVAPNAVLLNYSMDDMMNPRNQSRFYLRGLPLYDVHFTTKTFNVSELLTYGAKRVELTGNGYSSYIHRPITMSTEDQAVYGADVSFVGGYEKQRASSLNFMAEHGIKVRIWGDYWSRFKHPHPNLIIEMKAVPGDEYAKVGCSSKIMLNFLRKVNRDTVTTRSIEIPAIGAFMLAERTSDHKMLFREGIEAEFFDSNEELVEKTEFYLKHDEKRNAIAKAGLERCQKSGYSYYHQIQQLLETCNEILRSKQKVTCQPEC